MSNKISNLKIQLEDLKNRSIFVNWSNTERINLFSKLFKNMNLSNFSKMINYDRPTICGIKNGKVKPSGYVYMSLLRILNLDREIIKLEISSRNFSKIRIINPYIDPELIGLIHSDGHMNLNKQKKGAIFYFCNQNFHLIYRFKYLISKTFFCNFHEFKDRRDNTYYVYVPNIVSRIIASKIGWKNENFIIPQLTNCEMPSYIRGLFDGDGTVYLYKCTKYVIPTIRISTKSKYLSKNIKILLSRIKIYSRICHESSENNNWWNVVITKRKDFIKFVDKIGSSHPKKSKRLKEVKKFLLKRSGTLFPTN